jgi:hypothetical protein
MLVNQRANAQKRQNKAAMCMKTQIEFQKVEGISLRVGAAGKGGPASRRHFDQRQGGMFRAKDRCRVGQHLSIVERNRYNESFLTNLLEAF